MEWNQVFWCVDGNGSLIELHGSVAAKIFAKLRVAV